MLASMMLVDVTGYVTLAPGGIPAGGVARTVEAADDIDVDLDSEGRVLGVEIHADVDWRDGLAALAAAGQLAVVSSDGAKPELTDAEFARHHGCRDEPAARDADNRTERAGAAEPPRERPRIAMKLIPGNRKDFFGVDLRHRGDVLA